VSSDVHACTCVLTLFSLLQFERVIRLYMLVYVQDALYGEYGEGAPRGKGPNQNILQSKGNGYLTEKYPNLSYVISAKRI
jgi:hypothetical protein